MRVQLDATDRALLQQMIDALTAAVGVIPPTQRQFLNSATPIGVVIPVDGVPVAFSDTSPHTIEAADSDEVWALFAAELSFSAACVLTISGGSENLVISIRNAGIYSLTDRLLAYCQTNVNQAMTLTITAGAVDGFLYVGKGLP